MQIRFELENDTSILNDKEFGSAYCYNSYFDSYLEVYLKNNDVEILLFFTTTGHSTILDEFARKLIMLHQTGEEQKIDPFGNANIITLERKGNNLIITNFSQFEGKNEWVYTFNLMDFTVAYINELQRYLEALKQVDNKIATYKTFVFLKEEFDNLLEIIK